MHTKARCLPPLNIGDGKIFEGRLAACFALFPKKEHGGVWFSSQKITAAAGRMETFCKRQSTPTRPVPCHLPGDNARVELSFETHTASSVFAKGALTEGMFRLSYIRAGMDCGASGMTGNGMDQRGENSARSLT